MVTISALHTKKHSRKKIVMNTVVKDEEIVLEEWPIRPYYKRELAEAYAPNITPASALNRLGKWLSLNMALHAALQQTGYRNTQKIFTSMQVELIFRYLGRP